MTPMVTFVFQQNCTNVEECRKVRSVGGRGRCEKAAWNKGIERVASKGMGMEVGDGEEKLMKWVAIHVVIIRFEDEVIRIHADKCFDSL